MLFILKNEPKAFEQAINIMPLFVNCQATLVYLPGIVIHSCTPCRQIEQTRPYLAAFRKHCSTLVKNCALVTDKIDSL